MIGLKERESAVLSPVSVGYPCEVSYGLILVGTVNAGTDSTAGTFDSQEDSAANSLVFRVGVSAGAAGLAILLALSAVITCCAVCIYCRNKKNEVPNVIFTR